MVVISILYFLLLQEHTGIMWGKFQLYIWNSNVFFTGLQFQ